MLIFREWKLWIFLTIKFFHKNFPSKEILIQFFPIEFKLIFWEVYSITPSFYEGMKKVKNDEIFLKIRIYFWPESFFPSIVLIHNISKNPNKEINNEKVNKWDLIKLRSHTCLLLLETNFYLSKILCSKKKIRIQKKIFLLI